MRSTSKTAHSLETLPRVEAFANRIL